MGLGNRFHGLLGHCFLNVDELLFLPLIEKVQRSCRLDVVVVGDWTVAAHRRALSKGLTRLRLGEKQGVQAGLHGRGVLVDLRSEVSKVDVCTLGTP